MTAELRDALAFGSAALAAAGLTPAAIALARRTDFYDRPREYRQHARATPFLGGAAVFAGFLIAALALGATTGRPAMLSCAAVMWLAGTVDDRVAVPPRWRLLLEAAAAIVLYAAGLGWSVGLGHAADIVLTVVWVAGVTNALNLMDNMDGACATVAAAAGVGIGTLAALRGDTGLAALSFGLSGACAGFLPWNLAGPAKVFLGDGGSMVLGFLVAALAMAVTRHAGAGGTGVLVGAMLVGLPILDVALVSVSRVRRGVSLVTGGRDHLTHRLVGGLSSPRRVALALALGEAVLGAAAVGGDELSPGAMALLAAVASLGGSAAVVWLDAPRRRPPGIAYGARRDTTPAHATPG